MSGLLLPLKPIPIKERLSILFVEKWHLDVLDGAFVVVDKNRCAHTCAYWWRGVSDAGTGARISHAAVALAARVGTLLVWVGEGWGPLIFFRPAQVGARRPAPLLYFPRAWGMNLTKVSSQ